MGDLSKKEQHILLKFRNQISDLDLNRKNLTDKHLIRWLRARDLDITKAETMLRKHLKWRDENKVDQVLHTAVPQAITDQYQYETTGGFDKDGHPVFVSVHGKWDYKQELDTYGKELILQYVTFYCEEILSILEKCSNNDTLLRVSAYSDFENFSFRPYASIEVLEAALKYARIFESNYPEFLHCVILVNAPRTLHLLWNIIKPMLSEDTIRKVQIIGSDPDKIKAALSKQFSNDQIAIKYGGTFVSSTFNCLNVRTPRRGSIWNSEDSFSIAKTNLLKVTIPCGETLTLSYEVQDCNSLLSWAFETEDFDIGFSVKFNHTEEVVSYKRFESHKKKQIGSFICNRVGCYVLSFDNSYSLIRAKILNYAASLSIPEL